MPKEKQIALLFFSRTAAEEGRKKIWFSSKSFSKNKVLGSSLVLRTFKLLQKSGLDVFHYHEGIQRGDTFGERITNAYEEIFALGYNGVIAVGNDTPQIDNINWEKLTVQLESGKCVLGSTIRQGAYLIGITAKAFDRVKFADLPWQSNQLFNALCDFCSFKDKTETPLLLEKLRDVNSLHDLRKLYKTPFLGPYFKSLLAFLLKEIENLNRERMILVPSLAVISNTPLRAPPSL